jgi:hypothetical protein
MRLFSMQRARTSNKMPIYVLRHIIVNGSLDWTACEVDSNRMHSQGSILGETAVLQ